MWSMRTPHPILLPGYELEAQNMVTSFQPTKPDVRLSQRQRHAAQAHTGVRKCGRSALPRATP